MYQEWIDALASCALFNGISKESLGIMLDCLKPRITRCKQREIIATCGQPFQGIGIIASGKTAITKESYSGNRIIMGILGAGEILGEIVAFSDQKVWPMTVIAQEDCILLFLPPGKIARPCSNICSSHNVLITNMLKILSDRAYMLDKKIEHISGKNIRGKISSYLLDIYHQQNSCTLTMPLRRHELADYLNITRPSLSREMGLMRDAGIIEFYGSHLIIKNILALEESIC